jgi:hypothetical protein
MHGGSTSSQSDTTFSGLLPASVSPPASDALQLDTCVGSLHWAVQPETRKLWEGRLAPLTGSNMWSWSTKFLA